MSAPGEGGIAVGINYGEIVGGLFRLLDQALIPLDSLPHDLDLFDPTHPDQPVSRFRGRSELIVEIDSFLDACVARRKGGFLLVEAEAGMGKSALATYLAFTYGWPAHFTRLPEGRSPQRARVNLAAQLVKTWNLQAAARGGALPEDADTTAWLAGRLSDAAAARDRDVPGTPVVLLVDGLDEAPPPDWGQLPLGLPPALPAGTVIIMTARPGTVTTPTGPDHLVKRIDVESAANSRDLLAYLTDTTTGDPQLSAALAAAELPAESFCRTLLDRSGGVWIYAIMVLAQIRDHSRSPADIDRLPPGLVGYYADNVIRWRAQLGAQRWRTQGLPLLAALAAIRDFQPVATLAAWAGLHETETRDLIREQFRPFLLQRRGGDPYCYLPLHQSFRDFTTGSSLDANTASLERLVELAYELETGSRAAHLRITEALTPTGAADNRNWAAIGSYTRSYLAEHAALAGQLDDLVQDPGFLAAMPPAALLPWREALRTPAAHAAFDAYELALGDLAGRPQASAAWCLHVWARKTQAHALAQAAARQAQFPVTVHTAMWTGARYRTLPGGHTGRVNALAAVPRRDGRILLASAGDDGTVRLWDPETSQPVGAPLTGHSGSVYALAAVSRDGGALLASAGGDGTVRLWDPETSQPVGAPLTGHGGSVNALAAVPRKDGRILLASAGGDGTVRLWDPETGQPVGEPISPRRTAPLIALVAMPRGDGRTLLASAGGDRTVWQWDPETGQSVGAPFIGHDRWVEALVAVPRGDGWAGLASAGRDATVWVWKPWIEPPHCEPLIGHTDWIDALAAVPHGDGRTRLASASRDGTVRLWDPETGQPVGEPLTTYTSRISALAAVPRKDARGLLAFAGNDGTVRMCDPEPGRPIGHPTTGHTAEVTTLAAVPFRDGRVLLASAGEDDTVRLWDPETGHQVGEALSAHSTPVKALAVVLRGDGRPLLVSTSGENSVQRWDPETGRQVGETLTDETLRLNALAAVPHRSGRSLLASAGRDYSGVVRLWDPETGRLVGQPFTGHTSSVSAMAVAPRKGGRALIASAGHDLVVRLWDPESGRPLGEPLSGHTDWVNALAVIPRRDGRVLLASAGDDRTVRLWDPESGNPVGEPLTGHTAAVNALAAVPCANGRALLASAGDDRTVRLWDPESGNPVGEPLTGHTAAVNALAVVPRGDGRTLLASAGDDRAVLIWSVVELA